MRRLTRTAYEDWAFAHVVPVLVDEGELDEGQLDQGELDRRPAGGRLGQGVLDLPGLRGIA